MERLAGRRSVRDEGWREAAGEGGVACDDDPGLRITETVCDCSGDSPAGGERCAEAHPTNSASWQVLEERLDSSSNAHAQYVWGLGYVNDLVLRDRDADSNSGTGSLGKSSSGLEERLYAQQDANYNVTSLTNTSGTVVEQYQYDPYGKVTYMDGSWGSLTDTAKGWQYLFQGGRQDAATGDIYFEHRDYDTDQGRWKTADPLGYPDGGNRYAIDGNNPERFVDPTGSEIAGDGNDIHLDFTQAGTPVNRPGSYDNGASTFADTKTGRWYYWSNQDQVWMPDTAQGAATRPSAPTTGPGTQPLTPPAPVGSAPPVGSPSGPITTPSAPPSRSLSPAQPKKPDGASQLGAAIALADCPADYALLGASNVIGQGAATVTEVFLAPFRLADWALSTKKHPHPVIGKDLAKTTAWEMTQDGFNQGYQAINQSVKEHWDEVKGKSPEDHE